MLGAFKKSSGMDAAHGKRLLRSGGLLLSLLVALAVAHQFGVSDIACGAIFATASLLVIARHLSMELRVLGRARGVYWSLGLVAVALVPFLARVRPGPMLAIGEVDRVGYEMDLGPRPPAEVLLAASADVEEGGFFTYSVAAGADSRSITLLRRTFRSAVANGTHWHEDRPSAVVPIPLPPGVHTLYFARVPAGAPPLRVRVFSPFVPATTSVAFSVVVLLAFLYAIAPSITRLGSQAATTMTCVGILASVLATPDHAFAAGLLGLIGGLLVGVPAGAGLGHLLRWTRSLATGSKARARGRRDG